MEPWRSRPPAGSSRPLPACPDVAGSIWETLSGLQGWGLPFQLPIFLPAKLLSRGRGLGWEMGAGGRLGHNKGAFQLFHLHRNSV